MANLQADIDTQIGGIPGYRRYFGRTLTVLSVLCIFAIVLPLAWVLFDVFKEGLHKLNWYTFTQVRYPAPGLSDGGFGHAILGSLTVLSLGALISFPFGVLSAVYLAEFGRGTRLAYLVKFSCNVLTGVPAILAGLFAYAILVRSQGFSALSGGVALGVLMLPIVIRSTEEALFLVPLELRQGSIGLGSTRFQTTVKVVLPSAVPAIVTGLILALARAAGEAAPLLFTAFNNNFLPPSLKDAVFGPVATLPVMTYFFAIIPYEPQQELAWAGALVLLGIVLTVSLISRWVVSRYNLE